MPPIAGHHMEDAAWSTNRYNVGMADRSQDRLNQALRNLVDHG